MERKWLKLIGIIVGLLIGAGLGYSSALGDIAKLRDENKQLRLWCESLNAPYHALNLTYNWLKQHSFTYYTVKNDINISNVGIYKGWFMYTINGTITNIGNKPIKTVYVYLILRNPEGTADFSSFSHDVIENLYIGGNSNI
jgi:valyl-tRNA synthetase